jgi:hypothetical protein
MSVQETLERACWQDPKNDSKIQTKKEKKFRQTFEKMEGFGFVTPVTGLNRPNTGKEDDDDDPRIRRWEVPVTRQRSEHYPFKTQVSNVTRTPSNPPVALCGVVVSALAVGPKVRGFTPGRIRWIFNNVKIRSTNSFWGEIKPSFPCRNTLRHVKDPYRYENKYFVRKIHGHFSPNVSSFATRRLSRSLPEISDGWISNDHNHRGTHK